MARVAREAETVPHRGLLALGELEANLEAFARIEDKPGGEWISRQLREVREALAARMVVRDTEREHEPADDRRWNLFNGSDNPASVGEGKFIVYACGPRIEPGIYDEKVVPEARAVTAEWHAEVLAKALDQFFRQLDEDASVVPAEDLVDGLREDAWPTLQALGYPKEAGT